MNARGSDARDPHPFRITLARHPPERPTFRRDIAGVAGSLGVVIGNIRRLVPLLLLLLSALAGYAAIGVDLQMPLGNPAGAATDPADPRRFLLRRAQYALEYNDTTRTANWVSWSLGLADLGASGRGDFAADPGLPANLTRVQPEDYSGSGFDRGHLCPSGDRTVTVADNQATFYMTNILPQTPDHNQGVWASFETYCRSLAGLGNEILVISGPAGFGAERLPGGIAVPAHVWKIAVVVPPGPGSALSRITATTRVIAIKVPNIPGIRTNPWQQYLTSVARLQTDTGFTFFSELPPETAAALRAKVDEPSTAGAPRITTQPASQAAALGGAATFTVIASGTPPLTYQWTFNGAELPGATNATLVVRDLQPAQLGAYAATVANADGAVVTTTAALNLASGAGSLFWDFSAATATGGLPRDIGGGLVSQQNNNGTTALLTNASVSSGYPGASGGNNAGAAARTGPLNRAAGSGSAYFEFTLEVPAGRRLVVSSLSFGSRSTATGPQAFTVFTSADDFARPLSSGALANNSVWSLITPEFSAFAAEPGRAVTFRIHGHNGSGNAGVGTANWRIDDLRVGVNAAPAPFAPVVTRLPAAATIVAGGEMVLSVTAAGEPAPTFQWLRDGVAIPGATAATLRLAAATPERSGAYAVEVSNAAGKVTTPPAAVRVLRRGHAGTYFGRLDPPGGPGTFALVVQPDNTAHFLAATTSGQRAWFGRAIAVSEDGTFRFGASELSGDNSGSTATVNGAIATDGTLAADVSGGALGGSKLIGERTPAGGPANTAGFYLAGAAGQAGVLYAAVATSGRILTATTGGTRISVAEGTLSPAGTATLSPITAGQALAVTVAAGRLVATPTGSGGAPTFVGAAMGTSAVTAQRLVNLSSRAAASAGEEVVIAGFVVSGPESKPVLIRAIGPGLRDFGVTSALPAPRLELLRGDTRLATNAAWGTAPGSGEIPAVAARAGAFALTAGSGDAVIVTTLPPGGYTAVASAADGRAGVCLIEVYDLAPESPDQRLVNLSTRAVAGAGESTLTAGLVVRGTDPKRILIRAAGPALGQFGVTGFLARPELTLLDGGRPIAINSGWSTTNDSAAIAETAVRTGAFPFAPGSADAAILINLAPGAYTAQVGAATASGIALLEIYEVP